MTTTTPRTVFDAVLAGLAKQNIRCETQTHSGETFGSYTFADGAYLTWGAYSNTGAKSSLHPISAHSHLNGFLNPHVDHRPAQKSQIRGFDSGDYDTDAKDLIDWITTLADKHGRESL
ncbi:hypothetical protein ACFWGI_37940 [Streptomyces niveus]|uniref:hypothetical protein n=1 Tax=Streptomyces niveus TaxID=193462 RepID=UPI00365FA3EA